MKYEQLRDMLEAVDGCTFASLDAETLPCKGVRRVVAGESVILFTNKGGSGYENMVKKRLKAAGKDPKNFALSDLPWGVRIKGTPFIAHNGKHYLQTILLAPGDVKYFIGSRQVTAEDVAPMLSKTTNTQGLPDEKAVVVQTYSVDNIKSIRAMGEVLTAAPDEAPERAAPAPVIGPSMKMAALKNLQQDDDDGALEVWATASYVEHNWHREPDVIGAMREVMEHSGYTVVGIDDFYKRVQPALAREVLTIRPKTA